MIAIITAILAIMSAISQVTNFFAPVGRSWLYTQNWLEPNIVPGIEKQFQLFRRREIDEDELIQNCKKLGFSKENTIQLYESIRPMLNAYEYITMYRREKMTYNVFQQHMTELGYDPYQMHNLLDATEFFPSPPDLIRFAVREVYNPEIRAKFGMDEDITDIFLAEAKKAGLPADQAANFWAGHWELPSMNQGYAMLHRGEIEESELDLLMKTRDIMPWWRKPLKAIAYRVLSRVDVRRMYRTGTLDRDGVKKSYDNLGYNNTDAELMTDFTVKYENDESAGITRSSVMNAYRDDIITKEQLKTYLEKFEYSVEISNFWLSVAEYNKTVAEVKIFTDDIIELYRLGAIDLSHVKQELDGMDLPAYYVDRVIARIIKTRAMKMKVPSKADLLDWLENNVIDDIYFCDNMRLLGYRDRDIQNYLTQLSYDIDVTHRKYLPITTYVRWVKHNILSADDFKIIAADMKISVEDIDRMIIESQGS